MVNYINTSLMNVGKMFSIKGVVIHNDSGSMTPEQYVNWLRNRDKALGIAHYYINRHTIARVIDTYNIAYHCGDGVSTTSGNGNYIGYEVCQSLSASREDFLANEDMTLRQAAEDLLFYKLPVNRNTVRLHREFVPTSCLPEDTTELLTKQGWVKLKDIQLGDEIATYRLDDGAIIFDNVQHKVPSHQKDTWLFRDVEVTADHNMLWKSQNLSKYRLTQAKDMFNNIGRLVIPNAGTYTGDGIPVPDGFLKLLVATQADGHYMTRPTGEFYGLEFHLKKERKITLICSILDSLNIQYKHTTQSDGTSKIRVYDKTIKDTLEVWLEDKKFSWKLMNMNSHQREIFFEHLLQFDGCVAGNDYSSSVKQNIDIVQALASISGIGSKVSKEGNRVYFKASTRTVPSDGKLSTSAKRKSKTMVSCVTVNSGLILIRQHGRTTVVGNCPHKSWELHGQSLNAVKDYFIARILHFQSLGKTVDEMLANEGKAPKAPVVNSQPTTQAPNTPLIGGTKMYFTYQITDSKTVHKNTVFYYNGASNTIIALTHPDQLNIVKKIYKDNTGRDMPHYNWSVKAPWYDRFIQANKPKRETAG